MSAGQHFQLGPPIAYFLAGEPKKLGKVIRAANVKLELE